LCKGFKGFKGYGGDREEVRVFEIFITNYNFSKIKDKRQNTKDKIPNTKDKIPIINLI
jgi:hypothetical protein